MTDLNTSGFRPYSIGVLIRLDESTKVTAGGIHLTDDRVDKDTHSRQTGTIVAMGGEAFTKMGSESPKLGDRVYFAKYSGQFLYPKETKDGKEYRIVDDHDVRLFITE